MCGRLSQYRGIHDFVAVLSIPDALINHVGDQPLARYNAAPTSQLALLHLESDGLHADSQRWGWRPHWAKDRAAPINARVEKVAHGPFFRAIWPHRAICPVDNWFEWVDAGDGTRQPWLIRRRDQGPVYCAAIGQFPMGGAAPRDDDGFVIITADSAGGMLDVHDRRPVVFSPELAREWMDPATPRERAEQMVLLQGEGSDAFEWYRVDKAVGNVRNQGAGLIDALNACPPKTWHFDAPHRLSDIVRGLHTFANAAARIRAVLPVAYQVDQRVSNKGIPYIKPLQRTQLRDDFTNDQVASLACIYLTKTEHYQLDHFIGQYIQTRNLLSIPNIQQVLGSILERYPGKFPVMVNELNAWIDRKLGYRATHPEFPDLPL